MVQEMPLSGDTDELLLRGLRVLGAKGGLAPRTIVLA